MRFHTTRTALRTLRSLRLCVKISQESPPIRNLRKTSVPLSDLRASVIKFQRDTYHYGLSNHVARHASYFSKTRDRNTRPRVADLPNSVIKCIQ